MQGSGGLGVSVVSSGVFMRLVQVLYFVLGVFVRFSSGLALNP